MKISYLSNIMKSINSLYLIVAMFINISLFAQWINIPNPAVANTIVLPIANNKIIYAGNHQNSPSGGGYVSAYLSDDFGVNTRVYYLSGGTGTHPTMLGATSYNDSVICFNHNVGNYGLGYTANGFKSVGSYAVGGYGSYSMFNTSKHLFVLASKFNQNDTVMFKRVNTSSSAESEIYLPTYYGGNVNNSNQPKMSFINDSTGFILARYKSNTSKSVLLKTVDYGDTWSELLIDSINLIRCYSFPSTQVGYVYKDYTHIFKTTDGGISWYGVGNSAVASASCIAFSDDNTGYVGGTNGSLTKTTNGGLSWTTENSGTTANITGIYTFGHVAYYRTASNSLFKNYPKGVSIQEQEEDLNHIRVYPNPFSHALNIETDAYEEKLTIRTTDVLGKDVYSIDIFEASPHVSTILDLDFLTPGIYFISIESRNKSYSQRVVLSK